MKIIKDEKLIKRNGRIGSSMLAAAAVVLGGALYINLSKGTTADAQALNLMFGGFVGGYILMVIGLYLMNRFGGRPRVDEKIDLALKGLPGDYTIYHFTAPAAHVLVGPAGIWILLPYSQRGVMTFTRKRWRVKNGGFAQSYMSIVGLQGIGRPDLESESEINSVKKHLAKNLGDNASPAVCAVLLVTNEQMEVQAEGAPLPAIKIKQLKDFIRQKAKEKPISATQLAAVKSALPE